VFAVVCLCVCLSAVVAALVANKDIYINRKFQFYENRPILRIAVFGNQFL